MTQPSRTTETINRDNEAIREIMHQVRELTVPDRATLALGLVGHLATMMNRSQMTKLMQQLLEEAERVQDVPPNRQRDDAVVDRMETAGGDPQEHHASGTRTAARASTHRDAGSRDAQKDSRMAADGARPTEARKRHGDVLADHVAESDGLRNSAEGSREAPAASREAPAGSRQGVGQAGRGEFRSGRLL